LQHLHQANQNWQPARIGGPSRAMRRTRRTTMLLLRSDGEPSSVGFSREFPRRASGQIALSRSRACAAEPYFGLRRVPCARCTRSIARARFASSSRYCSESQRRAESCFDLLSPLELPTETYSARSVLPLRMACRNVMSRETGMRDHWLMSRGRSVNALRISRIVAACGGAVVEANQVARRCHRRWRCRVHIRCSRPADANLFIARALPCVD